MISIWISLNYWIVFLVFRFVVFFVLFLNFKVSVRFELVLGLERYGRGICKNVRYGGVIERKIVFKISLKIKILKYVMKVKFLKDSL